jgi:hypothetical protein
VNHAQARKCELQGSVLIADDHAVPASASLVLRRSFKAKRLEAGASRTS